MFKHCTVLIRYHQSLKGCQVFCCCCFLIGYHFIDLYSLAIIIIVSIICLFFLFLQEIPLSSSSWAWLWFYRCPRTSLFVLACFMPLIRGVRQHGRTSWLKNENCKNAREALVLTVPIWNCFTQKSWWLWALWSLIVSKWKMFLSK